jgi:hypothetical protein
MEKRNYSEHLGDQFELYKKFFDLSLELETRKACPFQSQIRLPHGINNKLDNLRRFYENKLGILISKNDLIVIALTLVLNCMQEKSKEFSGKKDGQGIEKFLEEFEDELVLMVKQKMFEERFLKWKNK